MYRQKLKTKFSLAEDAEEEKEFFPRTTRTITNLMFKFVFLNTSLRLSLSRELFRFYSSLLPLDLCRLFPTIYMEYEVAETETCKTWRENLRNKQAKRKIQARIDRVASGNFGDWKTESGEVRAMRIDYGPGYRL